jgi:hypothetical protein
MKANGIKDEIFLKKLNEYKSRLDNEKFVLSLVHYSEWNNLFLYMNKCGINKINDRLMRSLLESNLQILYNDVKNKARIYIKDSAYVIGIMDEYNILEYGQAFLRIRKRNLDLILNKKFRSDEVKKGKYRNLITYEYPVGWSNVIDDGGTSVILLPGNHGSVSIYDYEDPDMSLDDVIKMFTGEDMQMPDDIPEDEEMMDFNIEDFLKINKKEKTTIGEDNISAYLLDISYKGNDGEWHDESICAVKSKRSVVIMEMNVWDNSTDVSDNTVLNDNTDYAEENDEMLPKDKFKAVLFEELDKVINSIKPCGI